MAALPGPGRKVGVGPPFAARGPSLRIALEARAGAAGVAGQGHAPHRARGHVLAGRRRVGQDRARNAAARDAVRTLGERDGPAEVAGEGRVLNVRRAARVGEQRTAAAAPGGHRGVSAREPTGSCAVGREGARGDRDRRAEDVDRSADAAGATRARSSGSGTAIPAHPGEVAAEGRPRDRRGAALDLDRTPTPAIAAVPFARAAEATPVSGQVADEARVGDRQARRPGDSRTARDRAPGPAPSDRAAPHRSRRSVTGGIRDEGDAKRRQRTLAANRSTRLARVTLRTPSVADAEVLERETRSLHEIEGAVDAARVDRGGSRPPARDPHCLDARVEVAGHVARLAGSWEREGIGLGVEQNRVGPGGGAGRAALERRVVAGREHRLSQ